MTCALGLHPECALAHYIGREQSNATRTLCSQVVTILASPLVKPLVQSIDKMYTGVGIRITEIYTHTKTKQPNNQYK